jgi:hypothetical protein
VKAKAAGNRRSILCAAPLPGQASRRRVDVVDPVHLLRVGLDVGKVEIHDNRLLTGTHQDARERLRRIGVDLLVGNYGGT